MAALRPDLAIHVNKTTETRNFQSTWEGYIAPLRRWLNFNIEIGLDPFRFPYDPIVVTYYLMSEILRLNSIQSIKSWEAAVQWMGDLFGADHNLWRQNHRYKMFRAAAKKQWYRAPKQKLPLTIEQLLMMADQFQISQRTLYKIPFDLMVQWTALVLLFLTFSRPSEVLRRSQTKHEFGLNLDDISTTRLIKGGAEALVIRVDRFKNAAARSEVKTIYMRDTNCNDPQCTRCDSLNPLWLIRVMLHRRKKEARKARPGSKRQRRLCPETNPKGPLFVMHNGSAMTRDIIQKGVHAAVDAAGFPVSQEYTPYSLRIGATTHAHRIKLCHAKILQYVGWKLEALPDMAYRYTRYPSQSLQWMAYDMVHGITAAPRSRAPHTMWDPWRNSQRWADHT